MPAPRVALSLVVAAVCAVALPASSLAQTSSADSYYEFLMARRLESQGDQNGALAALQRAATADPRSASIRAEIAAFHLRHNRPDAAEQAANQALMLDADNPDAHRVLGMILASQLDNGQRAQAADASIARNAIEHLEKAAAGPGSGSDINLFYTLGRLYMRTGDNDKAAQQLNRAANLNPGSVQVRLSLAQAYIAARDLNGAIDTLSDVVDDNPRVAATLGQYLEQADRPAEAAKAYELALTVSPNNRDVKLRRIVALFKAKQYQAAADAAATAQTQHPDDLRFVRMRAQALVETGARGRAVEVLEGAAKANPTDLPTSFALAELYTKAGRPADAERTARQLVERNPSNADAMNYLGYLLADRGEQLDEAIRLVRKALDLDPQNPSFLDSLGWAYFRQGKLEDAERYLGPAADKLPRNSTIQDHFGDVLARRGRWQDAISAWTRALNGDGDDIDRATIEKKISDARARVR